MQARRQLHRGVRADVVPQSRGAIRLATADAALSFALRGVGSALYLERTQRRPLGTHVIQSMLFADLSEFDRWCAAEPLRFENPTLHQRLWRHGREYFSVSR